MDVIFRFVDYSSTEYQKCLSLRNRILRIPLGLSIYNDDLDSESEDIHLAGSIDNEIVSTLVLKGNPPIAKMRQVAVDSNYQGKNIGREMIRFAEDWLMDNNYSKLYCHARDVSIPFYLKLDYKLNGDPFTEIGIKHYRMEKSLE